MKEKQHHFLPSNDPYQSIHYVIWEPDSKPVAVLQLVHGMEEYIGRYEPLARAMNARGWAVIGHDHLGHGESGRWERGFFTEKKNGAEILIDDMHSITLEAKRQWPEVPVFIFGHSMGSFFTRRYLAEYGREVRGAVICGSGWYAPIATGTAWWTARFIGSMKGMHSRSKLLTTICSLPFLFAFRKEGKLAWLSRNKQNVANYIANPLCGFGFTCGGYLHMYRNLLLVSEGYHYEKLRPMPILVISGAEDPVGGSRSVRKIAAQYRKLGFADVTENAIPDNRHEILFEDRAPETIVCIADWLETKNTLNRETYHQPDESRRTFAVK